MLRPDPNPFSPPGAELAGEAAPGALYSPGQAGAAAFFGGPIGAAILIAQNYRDLDRPQAKRIAIAVGLAATAASVPLAAVLPERTPDYAIPLLEALVARVLAHRLQGDAYYSLRESGGRRQSNWRVAGIALACLVVSAAVLVGAAFLVPEGYWPAAD